MAARAKRLSCHWRGGVGKKRVGWLEGRVGAMQWVEVGAVRRKPGT